VAKTAAVVNAMKRSVSPLSRATSSAQAIGRAVKAAAAANAIARSASPRSALVGDWTDPKKLKEIAKDLQRQLQRKESDALRLNDRVQKLVALRDEQLIESQAERKRLHYALEQEEVEALAALMDFIIFHWGEVW
jgi:acyl-homoserine lactone acylase PvdQ